MSYNRALTRSSINQAVVKAQYAVRGEIALKAESLRTRIASGEQLKFDKVVSCNIGNPQELGQKGITFFRQVASLTEYPDLIDNPASKSIFPADALERAKKLVKAIGSVGAYSHSKGVPAIRQDVANFISLRDGFPADPESIYLTAGASTGVENIIRLMVSDPSVGVLIPIPQYPLYTASLALNEARAVPYYLNESKDWTLDIDSLQSIVQDAKQQGTNLRAIVIINPGNPTGNTLSEQNMQQVVKFAYDNNLVILADEVYQSNIFNNDRPFVSFKKVLRSMEEKYSQNVELISFHSISKGQVGECGRRGGYFELVNIDPQVQEQVYKLASVQLCPPLQGQIGIDLLVNPPKPGDESYELYRKEIDGIQSELKKRSEILWQAFTELPGVECNPAQGAMYLFPKLSLPPKAVEAAKKEGKEADAFYCLRLLDATGICVVPGSGFGQEPGTLHFRTTFLAPGVQDYVDRLKDFHKKFLEEFS